MDQDDGRGPVIDARRVGPKVTLGVAANLLWWIRHERNRAMELSRFAVAVDGSPESKRAVAAAADLAKLTGATLQLVTVVRPPEGWWGIEGSPPTPEAMSSAIASARSELLAPIQKSLDIEAEAVLEVGEPGGAIINFCSENDIDMLFVGRRGAGVVERVMMGSVADRLAHNAPCPVVIVP
jgi:nucleotide-binding universal stress UspA family protein